MNATQLNIILSRIIEQIKDIEVAKDTKKELENEVNNLKGYYKVSKYNEYSDLCIDDIIKYENKKDSTMWYIISNNRFKDISYIFQKYSPNILKRINLIRNIIWVYKDKNTYIIFPTKQRDEYYNYCIITFSSDLDDYKLDTRDNKTNTVCNPTTEKIVDIFSGVKKVV